MKVLVTGANGFAGTWLTAELEAGGHEVVAAPSQHEVDLATSPDLAPLIREVSPDAVAHLAGMAFAPDAKREPEEALRVNAGGTEAVLASMDRAGSNAPVLIVSSGDVYGRACQVEFVARLRAERRFPTVAELVDQIHRDVATARALLQRG